MSKGQASHGNGELTPTEAILLIESFEKQVVTAEWKSDPADGTFGDPNDLSSFQAGSDGSGFRGQYRVLIEPQSGRYRVESREVRPWVNGLAPHIASEDIVAVDGAVQRVYTRSQPGNKVPEAGEGAQIGQISQTEVVNLKQTYGVGSGMYFFPPYFFGEKLSNYLRQRIDKKQPVKIVATADGNWVIETTPPDQTSPPGAEILFRIVYHPKDGRVSEAFWIHREGAEKPREVVWKRLVIDSTPVGNYWVPKSCHLVNHVDKEGSRILYSEQRVNHKVEDARFAITFPPGTRVEDDVEKKRYTVTKGVVDEQRAIKAYMNLHGLDWEPEGGSRWLSARRLAILGAIAVMAVATALALWARRSRAGKATAAATAITLTGCWAGSATAADLDRDGNWVVRHGARGEPVPISQCGFNVVVFSLEYFKRPYEVAVVSASLPPTAEGIRLLDIKNTLTAHGCRVVPRRGVTLEEIGRTVTRDTIALFPVKLTESVNHYFLAAKHPTRGTLLLDPPNGAADFADAVRSGRYEPIDGVVLFVAKRQADSRSPPPPQSDGIAVTPPLIELGPLYNDDPQLSVPVVKTVKLTNVTDDPIAVNQITTVCGCLIAQWQGRVLAPRESVDVPVTIIPGAWQAGSGEKRLGVLLGDGSSMAIRCAVTVRVRPELDVLQIECDDSISIAYKYDVESSRRFRLRMSSGSLSDVAVKSDTKWLSGLVRPTAEGGELVVTCRISERDSSESVLTGALEIRTPAMQRPRYIRVTAERVDEFRPSPPVINLSSAGGSRDVKLTSVQDSVPKASRVEMIKGPSGLRFDLCSDQTGQVLQVSAETEVRAGIHKVSLALVCEDGLRRFAELVVMIPEVR